MSALFVLANKLLSPRRGCIVPNQTVVYMGREAPGPQQKIGDYVLLEKLGAGGIGEVWKARDRRLNRVVALKFIYAERQGSTPTRDLLREARAASALNHPNIVTIFEVGESEGRTYLAMEFVEGETLRARMKREPLPLEEALEIAGQVARGLAAAHGQGIVHRDLKPENIMIRADGYVKLLDFGLAKVLPWARGDTAESVSATAGTESGQVVGTFTYMSPEQARGLPVSAASDVFSFGIVLYEMLGGKHPFRGPTVMDTIQAILSKEPPAVKAPGELSVVVVRALKKEETERFPTARELGEALAQTRAAQAAPAAPLPAARPQQRWMQVVGGALIALLLTTTAWFLRTPSERVGAAPVQSVAVMNFRTGPEDARAAPLAQGLPEELGSALSKAGLRVASESSVQEFKSADARAIGAQLGVDAVLAGTVRSYGSKFKVHVELVNARTGFQIWSGTFTAESEDLLGTEQKTAGEIARELQQALAGRR